MYEYTKQEIGGFVLHTAHPGVGLGHLKRFEEGVTPQNQATLNLYIAGRFLLQSKEFQQVMVTGQTSLDLNIEEYPAGLLFAETVLAGPAVRCCVSKDGGGKWSRGRVAVGPEWIPEHDGVLIYFDGTALEVTAGVAVSRHGEAMFCCVIPTQ